MLVRCSNRQCLLLIGAGASIKAGGRSCINPPGRKALHEKLRIRQRPGCRLLLLFYDTVSALSGETLTSRIEYWMAT